jgi:hypothetical protein
MALYSLRKSMRKLLNSSLIETAKSDPTVSIETAGSELSNDYLDFLGDYGDICKMA